MTATQTTPFIADKPLDVQLLNYLLVLACEHYEKSAPTVSEWANNLYIRMGEDRDNVRLSELLVAQNLMEIEGWCPPNLAANRVYKLMQRLGQDVTGHAGF